jgi:hypothetical protein
MKKNRAKLHLQREVVRALKTKELRLVEGGSGPGPDLPWTSDSHNACCA